jgi:A/G-specific adenine glycosylase
MKISLKKKQQFQKMIWDYYHKHGRGNLPWRNLPAGRQEKINPYRVWVSEIMLQQTQVDRVVPFFNNWMKLFPTVRSLATAPQSDVLRVWKGLGYNSRALRMKRTAQEIVEKRLGVFPRTYDELIKLPGIGPYTAGAIMAFAYDKPVTMIETNIRRVFIHHFFSPLRPSGTSPSQGRNLHSLVVGKKTDGAAPLRRGALRSGEGCIHDRDILNLVTQTLPSKNFREWYWALMDYGSYLGKTIPNPNKKSRHYTVQKKFKGSDREIRGKILEILLNEKKIDIEKLVQQLESLSKDKDRIERIVDQLEGESFLEIKNGKVFIKK